MPSKGKIVIEVWAPKQIVPRMQLTLMMLSQRTWDQNISVVCGNLVPLALKWGLVPVPHRLGVEANNTFDVVINLNDVISTDFKVRTLARFW